MNVPGISPIQLGPQASAGLNFTLPGGDDFAGKLQLGQIIKGRVLRQYDGGRYGVEFNGREKLVDSAVPLKTGELLYGKVVGLGERVELERVRNQPEAPDSLTRDNVPNRFWSRSDRVLSMVADVFEQHQLKLTAEQTALIEHSVRAAADPRLMAMSGVMLAKLGIALAPEWLKLIYETLRNDPTRGLFQLNGKAIELEIQESGSRTAEKTVSQDPVAEIAESLKQLIEEIRSNNSGESAHFMEQDQQASLDTGSNNALLQQGQSEPDLGRWLLNVQTGGSVQHRVNTIPLLINGRLVELNIAIFDQCNHKEGAQDGLRHRQLSFSINSDILGQVEAHLVLTGEHIKMMLASDREKTMEHLAAYSSVLRSQLKEEGWTVDRLSYEVSPVSESSIAKTVLQHVVSQDSMSVLI